MSKGNDSWPPKGPKAKAWLSFAVVVAAAVVELLRALLGEPAPVDIHIHPQDHHGSSTD